MLHLRTKLLKTKLQSKNYTINKIFFCLGIIGTLSFSSKEHLTCVNDQCVLALKKEIKKDPFFKEYSTKKYRIQDEKKLNNSDKCFGLYYITFTSKDGEFKAHFPLIIVKNDFIFNVSIYEGKKVLNDTSGILSRLNKIALQLKDDFNLTQIDSMKNQFMWGVFSTPSRKN